jgi:vacuolar protein sorting-associated protein 13A/C
MNLTAEQYVLLMSLLQSIPRAFTISAEEEEDQEEGGRQVRASQQSSTTSRPQVEAQVASRTVDLLPELATVAQADDGQKIPLWPDLELTFSSGTIYLELFAAGVTSEKSLVDFSLARFALNGPILKSKMMSDSSVEAEFLIRSFTFHDTRPAKQTKWREIIPACEHDGHQFMVGFTMSGGPDRSSIANVTLDTPTVIFSLDPLFALVSFFTSAFQDSTGALSPDLNDTETDLQTAERTKPEEEWPQRSFSLAYRVNISKAKVVLLAEPERADTEAIMLAIDRVQMAQQGTLVLTVEKMGMFLLRAHRWDDRIRVLDDFDLSFSLDNHSERGRQLTNVEIAVQPLILRTSYRDVFLATTIVNKAIELSNQVSTKPESGKVREDETIVSAHSVQIAAANAKTARGRSLSIDAPQVMMTQQTVSQAIYVRDIKS